MSVNVLYTTAATATGGRDGHATTKDGSLDIKLATPKELGGAGGAGNNPEQLFAAGYAACFLSAMKFVATQGGPKVPQDTSVTAPLALDRARRVALAWILRSKSHFRVYRRPMRNRWSIRPTWCARTRMRPGTMFRSDSSLLSPALVAQ